MSIQLFSFGHPCEHQLRRTCIGGSSCPLNGYPDTWCCSYIKGKINFKRDKPCEGVRCRWGFVHPTQQQFDAVTQVLNESRPIATKIDEAESETELLSFHIDSPHIVDTVQCSLHMMRHPPSSCARSVGQLLAYAAVKSGDAKVFMSLLKTMKKPVDNYILGAYLYLTQGNPPTPVPPTSGAGAAKGKKEKVVKKEDVVEELKNDLVDIMNAALSHGGHLVDREDQHTLQATLIQALKTYPATNKKRAEMLSAAIAKFGNRQVPKNPPPAAAKESVPTTPPSTAATAPQTASTPAAATAASTANATPTATAATAATAAAKMSLPSATKGSDAVKSAEGTPAPAAAEAATAAAALSPSRSTPAAAAAAPAPGAAAAAAKPAPVGISKIAQIKPLDVTIAAYKPLRTDLPLPDVFLFGGLFALNPKSAGVARLGAASTQQTYEPTRSAEGAMDNLHVMATGNNLFADNFFESGFDATQIDTAQLFRDLDGWNY